MRIISQNGMTDVPYEQIILYIDYRNNRQIMAAGVHCNGENTMFSIAVYSTEAKAKRAMEMLREEYRKNRYEEVYVKGNYFYKPTFQFPADEDVEM